MEKVISTIGERYEGRMDYIQVVHVRGHAFVVKYMGKDDKVGVATGETLKDGLIKPMCWAFLISITTGQTEDRKFWVIEDGNAIIKFDYNKAHHYKLDISLK